MVLEEDRCNRSFVDKEKHCENLHVRFDSLLSLHEAGLHHEVAVGVEAAARSRIGDLNTSTEVVRVVGEVEEMRTVRTF